MVRLASFLQNFGPNSWAQFRFRFPVLNLNTRINYVTLAGSECLTFQWHLFMYSGRRCTRECHDLQPPPTPTNTLSLMELAIAQTVYGLAVAITSFIAEHDDKDAVNKQISDIVVQIQNIIHPLLSRRITNTPLQQCLQGLQIELTNTHEHMKMWKERRSRRLLALINPWAVTQQLKDDQKQLMDRYHLLIGAMQVFHHLKENSLVAPPSKVDISQKDTVKRNRIEVLDFWERCIGHEVSKSILFSILTLVLTFLSFKSQ